MGAIRIHWGTAGKLAGAGAVVLLGLQLLPGLLQAPEPPPLEADVGLPRIGLEPPPERALPPRVAPAPRSAPRAVTKRRPRRSPAAKREEPRSTDMPLGGPGRRAGAPPTAAAPPPSPPPPPPAPPPPPSPPPTPEPPPPGGPSRAPEPPPPASDGSEEFAPH